MPASRKVPNKLLNETSSYLLQHAYNPVDWFPWGNEAFEKAEKEDKPVFLSIGYSSCHWCHVMERESFEKENVAEVLNKYFVSIKVDKEQRPDVDNVYMRFCQSFTGSGGWPLSVFITPDGKPFYAGTYFPKERFVKLLLLIRQNWDNNRKRLLKNAENIIRLLQDNEEQPPAGAAGPTIEEAVSMFKNSFDNEYGGFSHAPKFPSAHNLMFLLYKAPAMAEKTLLQMYKGGIFDHIGYGFCRYSTDRFWLVPHFEKMLYDNALLANAYLLAYELTSNSFYKDISEKVFIYVKREMTSPEGGFYSAQDADSEGEEGKFYTFTPQEVISVLGEIKGAEFNGYFDITEKGNFEDTNIPNIIKQKNVKNFDKNAINTVYEYRKKRVPPDTDKKIITAWNALMLSVYANAYRILRNSEYLKIAENAFNFIQNNLFKNGILYSGLAGGKLGEPGFLDDYAFYIYALICMHQAALEDKYLSLALELTEKTIAEFFDNENGGFYFSGKNNEKLILNPKETYDNAMPSGNSVMAYNLSRLEHGLSEKQNSFMNAKASEYPAAYGFYLFSCLPVKKITCALKNKEDLKDVKIKSNCIFRLGDGSYKLINDKTTFYVCEEGVCYPPANEILL